MTILIIFAIIGTLVLLVDRQERIKIKIKN